MKRALDQQPKAELKWQSISALVLGIISLPLGIFFGIIGAGFPAWLGFIFGVMGLKSPARNIAITGIILCIVGFAIGIYWVQFITSNF
jgi:hypothetical protein